MQDLSILISSSQTLMREYAKVQLKMIGFPDDEARLRASSCVSQRDIQVGVYVVVASCSL